ncbi:ATP-binding protein [Streptosporangium sp. NPDC051022]|uniref:ATP-binding protein n=1 Tax=Streptosporangium sp. NPDC051022 TaxID=3155752 RepID=UPI00343CA86A
MSESAPQARNLVTTVLADWGMAGECVDDVGLCVTELAANALIHGGVPEHGFMVKVAAVDGFVRIEVHDHSTRHPQMRYPAGTDLGGRGLMIVNELADSWGVNDQGQDGKAVWAHFKFPAAVGAGQLMSLQEQEEELCPGGPARCFEPVAPRRTAMPDTTPTTPAGTSITGCSHGSAATVQPRRYRRYVVAEPKAHRQPHDQPLRSRRI